MKKLFLFLFLSWALPSSLRAQIFENEDPFLQQTQLQLQPLIPLLSQPALQPSHVLLTEGLAREALEYLRELRIARAERDVYKSALAKFEEIQKASEANAGKALETEKRFTQLTERERDLMKDKADFYKSAFEIEQKKGKKSLGCKIKKLLTLGLARCP